MNRAGFKSPATSTANFLSSMPISLATRCPTTFKQPAYPAKTYSTGLGPASVPPKSAGSSTTSNQTAPNLLYNSPAALFFNQERSHKIVLLFILRMNNDTTPGIGADGVWYKTDFMSKIIKISFNVLTGYLPECR